VGESRFPEMNLVIDDTGDDKFTAGMKGFSYFSGDYLTGFDNGMDFSLVDQDIPIEYLTLINDPGVFDEPVKHAVKV
jgi:hypothetical protein